MNEATGNVSCSSCNQKYSVPESWYGREIRCQKCLGMFKCVWRLSATTNSKDDIREADKSPHRLPLISMFWRYQIAGLAIGIIAALLWVTGFSIPWTFTGANLIRGLALMFAIAGTATCVAMTGPNAIACLRQFAGTLRRERVAGVLIAFGLFFAIGFGMSTGLHDARFNYLCLVFSTFLVAAGLSASAGSLWKCAPRRPIAICGVGVIVSIAAWQVWSRVDVYEHQWRSGTTEYIDRISRRTGDPVHRRVRINADGISTVQEGEMRGSPPKPHGHWAIVIIKPKYEVLDRWYWYGDQITQGEWELRRLRSTY